MAHTHEFDCKVCGVHLDSAQDLERHNREKHSANSRSDQSSFNSSSGSASSDRSSERS